MEEDLKEHAGTRMKSQENRLRRTRKEMRDDEKELEEKLKRTRKENEEERNSQEM